MLAAERRGDGAIVYLDFEGDWHEDLAVAVVARAADERRALADRAAYEAQRATMLRPHLLEVSEWCGRVSPTRAAGKSAARASREGSPVAPIALAGADDSASRSGNRPPVRELARSDAPGGYPPWAA